MRALPYFLVFVVPLLLVLGLRQGGWWTATGLVVLFVVIPTFEVAFGRRTDNDRADDTRDRIAFDLPLLIWIPVQLAVLVWAVDAIVIAQWTATQRVLAVASVGVVTGGLGMTVAHELMHRPSVWHRALAEVLMSVVAYTHFVIEHVHGHHRNVATPLDSATSRLGESLYAFLPRTVVGGVRSAWRIETDRLRRLGRGPWHASNRMLRYGAVQVAIAAAVASVWGGLGLAVWFGQAAVAILLLEIVNYLEHYGLVRKEVAPGKHERVQPWHSWNAAHRLTNWLLFNLQRHSDHHYLASRPYDRLRHYDEVPQLPAGYATMVLVALVPPLWRRVMDPRVIALRGQVRASASASESGPEGREDESGAAAA
jgi:alkane 1-monooxygenase